MTALRGPPADARRITPAWLASVGVAASRPLQIAALPGANPRLSQVFRVSWAGGSAVVKLPARDPRDRRREAADGAYIRELGALTALADLQGGALPRLMGHDRLGLEVAFALEDLGPPAPDPLPPALATRAAAALARLHARRWGDPDLSRLRWPRRGPRPDIWGDDPAGFAAAWPRRRR